MRSEKRKYIRFLAQDKIYAALGTHFSRVGKLKDISVVGLAFDYIENIKSFEPNSSIISIFHSEDDFFLSGLACALIYDRPICVMANKLCLKQIYVVKKCGILFTAINTHQREKLDFFLNNYTSGSVPLLK
jgi:hypothetical protein